MGGDGRQALLTLRNAILQRILLRRTKTERHEDIRLPPLGIKIERLDLHSREKRIYVDAYQQSLQRFERFEAKGTLRHNYAHVFELLSRLRQCVDHPYLVEYREKRRENENKNKNIENEDYDFPEYPEDNDNNDNDDELLFPTDGPEREGEEYDNNNKNKKEIEEEKNLVNLSICGICQDGVLKEELAIAKCRHSFHMVCIERFIKEATGENINLEEEKEEEENEEGDKSKKKKTNKKDDIDNFTLTSNNNNKKKEKNDSKKNDSKKKTDNKKKSSSSSTSSTSSSSSS